MISPLLPGRMTMERVPAGTLYRLPKRDLGKARGAGLFLIGFGGVVTAFMVFWMWGPIADGLNGDGPVHWLSLVFGLFGLPGLLVGLGLVFFGLAVLLNTVRADVLVTQDAIVSTEWFGPIPWRRRRRLADVDRLVVAGALSGKTADATQQIDLGADLGAIRAEGKGMKPMLIAPGYPKPLIQPLARQLAAAADAGQPGRLIREDARERIEVVAEVSDGGEDIDDEVSRQQPAGSPAVFREQASGISIAIPPADLWKGSKGLFGVAILWNVLCLISFGLAGYGIIDEGQYELKATGAIAAFAVLFFGVGAGLLMGAIEMGRRQAAIVTHRDELHIQRISLFKSSEYPFRAAELKAICVGPSGLEVNDRPVMELQIHPASGKKVGMLSQLDDQELHWIAARLRHALDVPRHARD